VMVSWEKGGSISRCKEGQYHGFNNKVRGPDVISECWSALNHVVLLMRKGRSRNDARRRGPAEGRGNLECGLKRASLMIFASLLTKKHGGVGLDEGDPGFRNTIGGQNGQHLELHRTIRKFEFRFTLGLDCEEDSF